MAIRQQRFAGLRITLPGLVPTSTEVTDGGRGWLGRFGGGCDYQLGGQLSPWVVGAFGNYDVMNLNGTNAFQNDGLKGVAGDPTAGNEKESWAWYVGGRIGYLITPNLLTYWDGGYTQTRFDNVNFVFTNTGLSAGGFLPATTYHGWFLGGGYEYALNFSWLPVHGLFWRTEYQYSSYNAQDVPLLGDVTPGFGEHSTKYVQTVVSSLVWRFNWFGH